MVLKPCVRLPTEQLPWSSATVEKVLAVPCIQKTQPAATRPVRPSGSGSGIGASNASTPAGTVSVKVIAIGGTFSASASESAAERSAHFCEAMPRTLAGVPSNLTFEIERGNGGLVLVVAPLLAGYEPHHLELVAVRVAAIQRLRGSVIALTHERAELFEHGASLGEVVDRGDFPREVIEPDGSPHRALRSRTEREQPEVVM